MNNNRHSSRMFCCIVLVNRNRFTLMVLNLPQQKRSWLLFWDWFSLWEMECSSFSACTQTRSCVGLKSSYIVFLYAKQRSSPSQYIPRLKQSFFLNVTGTKFCSTGRILRKLSTTSALIIINSPFT